MTQLINSNNWDEIDLSERYLVCGHFNEACSLASSQIQNLRTTSLEPIHEIELSGMMESAGMVFVQSLRELGRTSELFAELIIVFGSVEAIPIQVFLTGTCMQISDGITSNLRAIFEEFLKKWRYVDNDHYVLPKEDQSFSKCPWQSTLDSEKYLEVAEVFTMILLRKVLHQPELAISWTEKSDLPEAKRQDMLGRLYSMHIAQTVEMVVETSSGTVDISKSTNANNHMNGHESNFLASSKTMNPSIKHLTNRSNPFWWFSTVRLKFGSIHQLLLPPGRIILLCFVMAFASYLLRNKASYLRKFAWRQALLIRRALMDAWQLAFSVQVNPLAAVQQISPPRSNR